MVRLATHLLFVLSLACGGDDDMVVDAGDVDGAARDGGAEGFVPAVPAAPALPTLGPCRDGWRELSSATGPSTCEPWSEGGRADCPAGAVHFPGEPGCLPVGSACPAGDLPDLPADATAVYALEGAVSGDGTRGAPFGSIRDAMGSARTGTVLGIGRGTYLEEVSPRAGVELRGACSAATTLRSDSPSETAGTVTVRSMGSVLRDLRIEGSARPGVWAGAGAAIHLEGIILADNELAAIIPERGGMVTAHELVVRDTRGRASDGNFGNGVSIELGGHLELSRAVFERNRAVAVSVTGEGSFARLEDVAVVDTLIETRDANLGRALNVDVGARVEAVGAVLEGNRDVAFFCSAEGTVCSLVDSVVRDTAGRGLGIQRGATATMDRVVFDRNVEAAVRVGGMGTVITVSDLVVRDTRANATGEGGRGLNVSTGAQVQGQRMWLERQVESAMFVDSALVDLSDVSVLGTLTRPSDATHGRGLTAQDGAEVHLARSLFEQNHEVAVVATNEGASLLLEDLVVRDTQPRDDGHLGRALAVEYGAVARVVRALLEGNHDSSIFVNEGGSSLHLEDAVVRGTRPRVSSNGRGRGIEIQSGATAELLRVVVEDNYETGINVADASGTFEDLIVRDTHVRANDGFGGRGINMQLGSTVTLTGALIERSWEVGIASLGEGTSATLRDVVVRDVMGHECLGVVCAWVELGMGIGSYYGALVTVSSFEVRGAETCGLQVADDGGLDLSGGVVADNAIGACVQVDGYEIARLTEGVRYENNGVNLEATTLPVPAPVDVIGSIAEP